LKHAPLAAAALFVLGLSAAQAAETASPTDKAFIAKVSQGGMFEVQLGQLAATQGSTQDIRDQGATEAHDHALVGAKLKSIASDEMVTFPDTLNPTFQSKLDAAKALTGAAFDQLYLHDMLMVHAGDGAAFAKESTVGGDPKLRAFATETHRIVVRHIGELKALPAA
jgi:putative membrane protein